MWYRSYWSFKFAMYFGEVKRVCTSDQHITQYRGISHGTWWLNIATVDRNTASCVWSGRYRTDGNSLFISVGISASRVSKSVNLLSTFSNYQLNAQFFYFSTIYMLHYAPQHVSSSTLLILRRTDIPLLLVLHCII